MWQPARIPLYRAADVARLLAEVHRAQVAGEDTSFILPRLLELADPRLLAYNPLDQSSIAGPQLVADLVNAEWGSEWAAADIAEELEAGLPPG